jgi:hypothetical protein
LVSEETEARKVNDKKNNQFNFLKQKMMNSKIKCENGRRSFLKGAALATGALTLQGWCYEGSENPVSELPLRNEESATYLAFYDPAEGHVPNPGMGVSGYVHSDHMYKAYTIEEAERAKKLPMLELDRYTFNRLVELPYIDNLYLRYEWKDMQKERGKLTIPDGWKWTLEAAEMKGKRWSFRIMNFMKGSMSPNGLPDFLQGKFKMIPYWGDSESRGTQPKYFPEYSEDYLKYWGELNDMLGAAYDNHPLLEYVDISGFGFWGEMHHYAQFAPNAPQINYQPGTPEQVEAIIDRLIKDHLKAYPKTPAVLNLHAAEYKAGLRAFEQGLCWPRRDSFKYGFSTTEVQIAQGLMPGSGMVWEIIRPGIYCPIDSEDSSKKLYTIPQRYFDIASNYVAMGFNPWDAIWAHENCKNAYKFIEQNIGYRVRPSIIWRRKLHDKNELVLGLRNDGCVAIPGQVTIQALYSNGKKCEVKLPVGEPAPGKMKLYALPMLADSSDFESDKIAELTMKIQMKGKSAPVQWAVKDWQSVNKYVLKVPLRKFVE